MEKIEFLRTDLGVLYCGNILGFLGEYFQNESVDLIVVDLPRDINLLDQNLDFEGIARELFRVLKENKRCYVFSSQQIYFDVVNIFTSVGFRLHQTLMWYNPNLINLANKIKRKGYDFIPIYEPILNFHKGKPSLIRKRFIKPNVDVLVYSQPLVNFKQDEDTYICPKPLSLILHLIEVATDENDLVLNVFSGLGIVPLVCELIGRKWFAIDINKEYCLLAKEKITKELAKQKGNFDFFFTPY